MSRSERFGFATVAVLEVVGIVACFFAGQTALGSVWLASVMGIVAAAVAPTWRRRRHRKDVMAYWQHRMGQ